MRMIEQSFIARACAVQSPLRLSFFLKKNKNNFLMVFKLKGVFFSVDSTDPLQRKELLMLAINKRHIIIIVLVVVLVQCSCEAMSTRFVV